MKKNFARRFYAVSTFICKHCGKERPKMPYSRLYCNLCTADVMDETNERYKKNLSLKHPEVAAKIQERQREYYYTNQGYLNKEDYPLKRKPGERFILQQAGFEALKKIEEASLEMKQAYAVHPQCDVGVINTVQRHSFLRMGLIDGYLSTGEMRKTKLRGDDRTVPYCVGIIWLTERGEKLLACYNEYGLEPAKGLLRSFENEEVPPRKGSTTHSYKVIDR